MSGRVENSSLLSILYNILVHKNYSSYFKADEQNTIIDGSLAEKTHIISAEEDWHMPFESFRQIKRASLIVSTNPKQLI